MSLPTVGGVLTARSPVTGQSWGTPRLGPEESFRHEECIFQTTKTRPNFYLIHPDWISESLNIPAFRGRVNKPWPWEFPGARTMSHPKWDLPSIRQAWKAKSAIAEVDKQLHRPRTLDRTPDQTLWPSAGSYHFDGQDFNGYSPFRDPVTPNVPAPWQRDGRNEEAEYFKRSAESMPGSPTLPAITHPLNNDYRAANTFASDDRQCLRRMTGQYMTPCDW